MKNPHFHAGFGLVDLNVDLPAFVNGTYSAAGVVRLC